VAHSGLMVAHSGLWKQTYPTWERPVARSQGGGEQRVLRKGDRWRLWTLLCWSWSCWWSWPPRLSSSVSAAD